MNKYQGGFQLPLSLFKFYGHTVLWKRFQISSLNLLQSTGTFAREGSKTMKKLAAHLYFSLLKWWLGILVQSHLVISLLIYHRL